MFGLMMADEPGQKRKFEILYETYKYLMMKVAMDVLQDSYMDDFFLKDKKLNKLLKEKRAELEAVNGRKLNRLGITNTIVHSVSGLGATVGELLERHRLGG